MALNSVHNVPVVMQMEAAECGAACLGMVLAYHGRWEPLETLRASCGVGRDGSKLPNVCKAARSYGMRADIVSYAAHDLREKGSFPCIVGWGASHFVVLRGFSGKHAHINDPKRGAVKVAFEEFERAFSGDVLELSPTESFERGGKRASTLEFARTRLRGMSAPVVFVALSTFVISLATVISTSASSIFVDHVLAGESPEWLVPLLAVLCALVAAQCMVNIVSAIYLNRIRGKFAVLGASQFMWHLLHLPASFYEQRMVGDLQQRQEANETVASTLVEELAPALFNSLLLVLYLGVMLGYSWKLTLIGLVTVAINTFVANRVSVARVNVTRQKMRDRGVLYSTTIAGIESVETIKASGSEDGFFERWAGYQALVNEANVRSNKVDLYFGAIPQFLTALANVTVLLAGTYLIMAGEFTAGALLAFQGLLASFMGPVDSLISLGQSVLEMRTSMERVQDVLEYPAVDEDEGASGQEVSSKLSGRVEIDGVTFGYSPLEPPLVKDFSLTLKPGDWVALVGSSGSGKSTIAKLVSGMYEPWEGEVRFDGVARKDVPPEKLHASLAVVDQDIVTFSDTVDANVRLWDRSIPEQDVVAATRDACIHDDIMERELGYKERLSPGGRNFSGGQLQRLEIARALAQNPTVLILDEATSALDAKTEARTMEAIRSRGVTCIVVAHRLSTIRDCDEIIVLDGGNVVERGTHDELITANGAYAELVRSN